MKKVSLFEFNQFALDEQVQFLTDHGKYLAWRSEGEYNIYLYEVEDFFAEAWMNLRLNQIMKINCSTYQNIPAEFAHAIKFK